MSQGPLCPDLTQKVQKEVSQIANRNLSSVKLLGGLSVNLNHLKSCNNNLNHTKVGKKELIVMYLFVMYFICHHSSYTLLNSHLN